MKRWTDTEILILKNNTHKALKELAKLIGRSYSATKSKFHDLGLHSLNHRRWTKKEILFIQSNQHQLAEDLALKLDRSIHSVKGKLAILGLTYKSKSRKYNINNNYLLINVFKERILILIIFYIEINNKYIDFYIIIELGHSMEENNNNIAKIDNFTLGTGDASIVHNL